MHEKGTSIGYDLSLLPEYKKCAIGFKKETYDGKDFCNIQIKDQMRRWIR